MEAKREVKRSKWRGKTGAVYREVCNWTERTSTKGVKYLKPVMAVVLVEKQ